MSVAVVVDSASDLPEERAEALGIVRVPLTISIGGRDYLDGSDLSRERFWELSATSAELPMTAAPSPGQFSEAFTRCLDEGADGVICLTLTSKLSATFQAASAAAEAFPQVRTVDTRTLTLGEGLIALDVAEAARAGANLEELAARAEALRERVLTLGALDTLDNLRRGGRIGAATALIGTMMSFKPMIEITGGVVEPAGRQRTRRRAVEALLEWAAALENPIRVGLVHAMAADAGDVASRLREVTAVEEVVVSVMGATIGTHAGAGALGVSAILAAAPS